MYTAFSPTAATVGEILLALESARSHFSAFLTSTMDVYVLLEDSIFAPMEKELNVKFDCAARAVSALGPCLGIVFLVSAFYSWVDVPFSLRCWFTIGSIMLTISLVAFTTLSVLDLDARVLSTDTLGPQTRKEVQKQRREFNEGVVMVVGMGALCTLVVKGGGVMSFFVILTLISFGAWLLTVCDHGCFELVISSVQKGENLADAGKAEKQRKAAEPTNATNTLRMNVQSIHQLDEQIAPVVLPSRPEPSRGVTIESHRKAMRGMDTRYRAQVSQLSLAVKQAEYERQMCLKTNDRLEKQVEQLKARVRTLEAEKEGWCDVANLSE